MLFGSIVVYCGAISMLGRLGPVILWPIFMAFIVLSSNFWSLKYGEWKNCGLATASAMIEAVLCLFAAIVVLTVSAGIA